MAKNPYSRSPTFLKRGGFHETDGLRDQHPNLDLIHKVTTHTRCTMCGNEVSIVPVESNGCFKGIMFKCPRHGPVNRIYKTHEG